jgi:hypothetical protein
LVVFGKGDGVFAEARGQALEVAFGGHLSSVLACVSEALPRHRSQ